jgi:hypothetical protein
MPILSPIYNARHVLQWAFALLAVGLVGVGRELFPQLVYGDPVNLSALIGYSAIALTGLATYVVGKAIKRVEQKLAELEASSPRSK